jgi:hypothetical protein
VNESDTGEDIGAELISRAKEILGPDYRVARRNIRLIIKDENFTCHKEMFGIFKQDIFNFDDKLSVSMASFMLWEKLKASLRAHLNKIAHMIERACDRAESDDDFGTIFQYCKYLMCKHINDTEAKKMQREKRDMMQPSKYHRLMKEFDENKENRLQ